MILLPYVVINDDKLIPGVGQGPITTPIKISEGLCNRLILMGYTVLKQPEHSIHIHSLNRVDRLRLQRLTTEKTKTSANILDKVKAINERKEQAEEAEEKVEPTVEQPVEKPAPVVESEQPVEETTPVVEPKQPVEEVVAETPEEPTQEESTNVNVEEMTKDQLKSLLDDNDVDYKYHDNRSTLISKAKNLV